MISTEIQKKTLHHVVKLLTPITCPGLNCKIAKNEQLPVTLLSQSLKWQWPNAAVLGYATAVEG